MAWENPQPVTTWKFKKIKSPKTVWSVDHVVWILVLLYCLEVDSSMREQTVIHPSGSHLLITSMGNESDWFGP